jgi:DNA-binding MarR family transcriptional regulator
MSILSNTVSNAIARDYHDQFGLTVPEWRVMAVLGRFGPDAATELCARTAMDKVTVSRAMNRLIDHGLITRSSDSDDRRRVIARLTRKGKSIHDKIVPVDTRPATGQASGPGRYSDRGLANPHMSLSFNAV